FPRWDANRVPDSIVSFASVNGLQFFGDCHSRFGFRFLNRFFNRRTATEMSRRVVGTDYQHGGDELRDQRFVSWEDREPQSHPARNHWNEGRNRRGRNPMRELHLLRLFTHYHQQHHAEQNAGCDQHFAIRKTLLEYECQHRDDPRERDSKQCAFQNYAAAETQMISLQKQDDFESFAIKRSESEQDQSPEQRLFPDFVAIAQQRLAAAIVLADPAAPINFVEEPIHDHQQDD